MRVEGEAAFWDRGICPDPRPANSGTGFEYRKKGKVQNMRWTNRERREGLEEAPSNAVTEKPCRRSSLMAVSPLAWTDCRSGKISIAPS